MTKILFSIFCLFSFVMLMNGLVYAEHECTRTVTCSDGTTIITTDCSSSYSIIDGHRVDDNSDDPDHRHHHDDGSDDPCSLGHGHQVDDNDNSDDPYNLRHGQHRDYDPDDPYGLRKDRQSTNLESTQQSQ